MGQLPPPPPEFTTEGAEDTEGLRMISIAPRFAHQDWDLLWGVEGHPSCRCPPRETWNLSWEPSTSVSSAASVVQRGGKGETAEGVEKLDPGMGTEKATVSAGFRGPPHILLPFCVQSCS